MVMEGVRVAMSINRTATRFSTTTSWGTTLSLKFAIRQELKLKALFSDQLLEVWHSQNFHRCPRLRSWYQQQPKSSTTVASRPSSIKNRWSLSTARQLTWLSATNRSKSKLEWTRMTTSPSKERVTSSQAVQTQTYSLTSFRPQVNPKTRTDTPENWKTSSIERE